MTAILDFVIRHGKKRARLDDILIDASMRLWTVSSGLAAGRKPLGITSGRPQFEQQVFHTSS